eukprot:c24631_g1_i1 orf=146-382(+)
MQLQQLDIDRAFKEHYTQTAGITRLLQQLEKDRTSETAHQNPLFATPFTVLQQTENHNKCFLASQLCNLSEKFIIYCI